MKHINHPKAYVIFERIANSIGDAFFHAFAKRTFVNGLPQDVMESVDILPLMCDFAIWCLNDHDVGVRRFASAEQVAEVTKYWQRLRNLGEREVIPPEEWPPYQPRAMWPNAENVLSAWYQAAYAFDLGYNKDWTYIEGYSATQFDFALGSLMWLHIWEQMQRNTAIDAADADKVRASIEADQEMSRRWNLNYARLGVRFADLIKQHAI